MTGIDIDAAFAAANPVTDRVAARLPLEDAEIELVHGIVGRAVSSRPRRAPARLPRRRRLAILLAVTTAVVAVLAVLPASRDDGGPASAFAAPLVRFANASPLALLQLSGWHVVYADESANGDGEMHFVRGRADANGNPHGASYTDQRSLAGRVASLSWTAPHATGSSDRGGHASLATGLGVTAHRLVFEGGSRRAFDVINLG